MTGNKIHIMGVVVLLFLLSVKVYYLISLNSNRSYTTESIEKSGDAAHYMHIAGNLYSYNTYSDNNSSEPTQSATWRAPIWPLILASFNYITSNPMGLMVCKSILELLLILLSFWIIKEYGKFKGLFLLPFLFLLIEPQYLKYSITFLSESITAALMLLLVLIFSLLDIKKKYSILLPILAALVILSHPVSIFFVLCLFGLYAIYNLKNNLRIVIFHSIIFLLMVVLWPLRNHLTFGEGLYITASQGATFSKGWNEKVISEFTNVDGDLADENLNLIYLEPNELRDLNNNLLKKSKLLKKATFKFLDQSSGKVIAQILIKKVKSNFNPFPEKPKSGFLEFMGSIFRVLYLVLFIQVLYKIIKNPRLKLDSVKNRIYMIVLSIFAGQILMSSFIYTGLRFNSIYGLSLLFCFLYLNVDTIYKLFKADLLPINKQ